MIQGIKKALSEKFDALQQKVETLKESSPWETASTQETVPIQATPTQTRTWEERVESEDQVDYLEGSEDQVDYNLELNWWDDQSSN